MSTPATVDAGKTTGELRPLAHRVAFFSVRWRVSPSLASSVGLQTPNHTAGPAPNAGRAAFWAKKARPYGEYPFMSFHTYKPTATHLALVALRSSH